MLLLGNCSKSAGVEFTKLLIKGYSTALARKGVSWGYFELLHVLFLVRTNGKGRKTVAEELHNMLSAEMKTKYDLATCRTGCGTSKSWSHDFCSHLEIHHDFTSLFTRV